MSALPPLVRRLLLTGVGWAIGGYLIAWVLLAFDALTGPGMIRFPDDPFAFLTVVLGGVFFVIFSAVLLSSGSRRAASRRVMAVIGAVAMLVGLLVVELVATGGAVSLLAEAPNVMFVAAGVGAVLGWCTLAVGGARE